MLEVGTGSGYAAALLSRLAKEVYTVERLQSLAEEAQARLARLGYDNVHVLWGDGTMGWAEHAPFDAIAVAAGGPEVPRALLAQLAPGGRLVVPVGPDESTQTLVRVTRETESRFRQENLAAVRFVPLIGEQGWPDKEGVLAPGPPKPTSSDRSLSRLVRETAEPIADLANAPMGALLERIGQARVVLLGESTHGTSEFYRMRAHISRRRSSSKEASTSWPSRPTGPTRRGWTTTSSATPPGSRCAFTPFSRFPTWMWRNEEVEAFIAWLAGAQRTQCDRSRRVGFHGLDLYSLFTSIAAVLRLSRRGGSRRGAGGPGPLRCAHPVADGPGGLRPGGARRVATESSETAVVAMLRDLLARRLEYAGKDGERFFDAAQNARVVADAERYYRAMYYGSAASWNLRDRHMFDTLQSLLAFYGPDARGIVWEHNSHVGDAKATEMSARGELNVGELCRAQWGEGAYLVGFGTDHGTVAAASNWDEPMQRMRVRPAHALSYERLCHDSGLPAFSLALRDPRRAAVRDELIAPRLERAIGVVYRPDTEMASHYFQASLPRQFDEYVWFDETQAVSPLDTARAPTAELPETYPFGL